MYSRLFVTDLDHTFLRSDLTISRYSQNIWNQLSGRYGMGIATARSLTKSLEFLRNLDLNIPLILLDGALIADPAGKIIQINAISKSLADTIVEIGSEFDIDPFIIGYEKGRYFEKFLYPRKLNPYQKNVLKGYRNDPRLHFNPSNKALYHNLKIVYFGDEEQMRNLYRKIGKKLKNEIEAKLSPEKYGGGWFLTLLHPKGDKAHALEYVSQIQGCDLKHITVFGDNINDLGMFRLSGTSVAVANALKEVKEEADIILPHTNDQDGVARYLETLL